MTEIIKQKWNRIIHNPWFIPLRMLFITIFTGFILNIIFLLGIKFGFDLNIFAFHYNTTPLIILLGAINFVIAFLIVKLSTWFPGKKEFCVPDVKSIELDSSDIYNKIEELSHELDSRDLELQRTEFKYRNLFTMITTMANNMPDIIWSKNIKGKYQFINEPGAKIFFNTTPDTIIGKTDIEILEDLYEREEFINRIIELDLQVINSTSQLTSIETLDYDGKNMTFEIIKSPIISKLGKIEGIVGCARDITSKIESEKLIQRKENALELILYASREFLREVNWEIHLKYFITQLGSIMDVDRVLLFKRDFKKKSDYVFNLSHEWAINKNYLFSDFPYIRNMSLKEKFPRWVSMFKQKNIIKGNVKDFLEDEKEKFFKQGIKSTLCVPILVQNRLWGYIGFDNFEVERIWENMEVKVLKTSANIISAAIEQQLHLDTLETSEKQFRKIFEKINSGLILINSDTDVIEQANKEAVTLVGCVHNNEDIVGKKYKDGLCEITASQIEQFNRLISNESEDPFECSCIDKNGKARTCIKSISKVKIQDKEYVLLNFINITDKKTMDDKLNYQRNRYRQLIEKFNELILEVEVPSGKIKYVNIDFTDKYNIASDMTIYNIIDKLVYEKHQHMVLELLESANNGVLPEIFEFQAKHEKGGLIWVESTCNPITNEIGDVIGLEIICRNITARKNLLTELQIKKEFHETIIENVLVGLFYKDSEGKYTFCNNEFSRIVGKPKDQIIGKTARDLLSPSRSEITEEKDREIIGTTFTSQKYEMYLDDLDKYVQIDKSIIKNKEGTLAGIIGSIVDRTEIIKSRKEIEFKEKIYDKTLNDLIYPAFVRDQVNLIHIANHEFCKLFGKENCQSFLLNTLIKNINNIESLVYGDDDLINGKANSFEKDIILDVISGKRNFRMRKSIFKFNDNPFILTTLRDITEQNKLMTKLEEIKDIYRKTIDTLSPIIFVVDNKLRLVIYNKKFGKFFNTDKEEDLRGTYIFSNFSLFSQNIRKEYNLVLETKNPIQTEKRIYLENKEREFSIIKIPIIDDDNNVNYIVTLMNVVDEKGELVNENSLYVQ